MIFAKAREATTFTSRFSRIPAHISRSVLPRPSKRAKGPPARAMPRKVSASIHMKVRAIESTSLSSVKKPKMAVGKRLMSTATTAQHRRLSHRVKRKAFLIRSGSPAPKHWPMMAAPPL